MARPSGHWSAQTGQREHHSEHRLKTLVPYRPMPPSGGFLHGRLRKAAKASVVVVQPSATLKRFPNLADAIPPTMLARLTRLSKKLVEAIEDQRMIGPEDRAR
jgi:hypothetical protein